MELKYGPYELDLPNDDDPVPSLEKENKAVVKERPKEDVAVVAEVAAREDVVQA